LQDVSHEIPLVRQRPPTISSPATRPKGVNADLALRTYTTRLLGGDPKLVLHGGGNTSVKTKAKDLLGEDVEVICVKGFRLGHGQYRAAGSARP